MNNDFIIVERIKLTDETTLYKCRECGDEVWYVEASNIDFDDFHVEDNDGLQFLDHNGYGCGEQGIYCRVN